jgi:hypothetical protein
MFAIEHGSVAPRVELTHIKIYGRDAVAAARWIPQLGNG